MSTVYECTKYLVYEYIYIWYKAINNSHTRPHKLWEASNYYHPAMPITNKKKTVGND